MEYAGQVGKGPGGLQILVGKVGQGEGGLQIFVGQVGQCPKGLTTSLALIPAQNYIHHGFVLIGKKRISVHHPYPR